MYSTRFHYPVQVKKVFHGAELVNSRAICAKGDILYIATEKSLAYADYGKVLKVSMQGMTRKMCEDL